jgi:hypothetical protein
LKPFGASWVLFQIKIKKVIKMKLEKVKEKLEELESMLAKIEKPRDCLRHGLKVCYIDFLEDDVECFREALEDEDLAKERFSQGALASTISGFDHHAGALISDGKRFMQGDDFHDKVLDLMREMRDLYNGQQK